MARRVSTTSYSRILPFVAILATPPVTHCFLTALPSFFSDLWYDRWQEVWYIQPDFVEILTWNDYGESHYIGPVHKQDMTAFTTGEAPYNYVTDMPHDGSRLFLPYIIDMYKDGTATINQEGLTAWYRLTPKDSAECTDGDTTGIRSASSSMNSIRRMSFRTIFSTLHFWHHTNLLRSRLVASISAQPGHLYQKEISASTTGASRTVATSAPC